MKQVDQNNKKALVPRAEIRNGSEPGLRYQKIGRDPGIANYRLKKICFPYFDDIFPYLKPNLIYFSMNSFSKVQRTTILPSFQL
jgi:hypothetical protein